LTGNGTYDGAASSDYGDSWLKLSSALAVSDWFTPSNFAAINSGDIDIASNRAMLIPGTTYVTSSGKDFKVWLLDTSNLGGLQGSGGNVRQQFVSNSGGTPSFSSGTYGGVFANNTLFLPTNGG